MIARWAAEDDEKEQNRKEDPPENAKEVKVETTNPQ